MWVECGRAFPPALQVVSTAPRQAEGHTSRVEGAPWLKTSRLTLRRSTVDDVDSVFAIHNDPSTYLHLPSARMTRPDQAARLVEAWLDHWEAEGFGYACVRPRAGGSVLGFAGAKRQTIRDQPALNLYYRFDPAAWGHGYATEAVLAVLDWLRGTYPELPVVARVASNNPASARVAQRVGLTRQRMQDLADPVPHHLYASRSLESWE